MDEEKNIADNLGSTEQQNVDAKSEPLTEEQIEKYKQILLDSFKDVDTSNPQNVLDFLKQNYIKDVPNIERPEKILSCPHEIVFTIIANVLEENEKGETIGSKEVCQKNYHIPVPAAHDYNMYMDSFFKYLENCIKSSAKHATEKSEPKDNE